MFYSTPPIDSITLCKLIKSFQMKNRLLLTAIKIQLHAKITDLFEIIITILLLLFLEILRWIALLH